MHFNVFLPVAESQQSISLVQQGNLEIVEEGMQGKKVFQYEYKLGF